MRTSFGSELHGGWYEFATGFLLGACTRGVSAPSGIPLVQQMYDMAAANQRAATALKWELWCGPDYPDCFQANGRAN